MKKNSQQALSLLVVVILATGCPTVIGVINIVGRSAVDGFVFQKPLLL